MKLLLENVRGRPGMTAVFEKVAFETDTESSEGSMTLTSVCFIFVLKSRSNFAYYSLIKVSIFLIFFRKFTMSISYSRSSLAFANRRSWRLGLQQ